MPAKPDDRPPPADKVVLLMSLQTAVFLGVGIVLWTFSGRSAGEFLSVDTGQVLLGIAIAAGMSVTAGTVFFGLPRVAEYLVRAQAHTLALLGRLPMWAVLCVSLGAGIGEEALFRGGIQTLASDYLGAPLAIVLSAALFALVHLAKPVVAVLIFLIGVLFGAIYWASDSLLAVMIGHALYDVFALWYVQKEMHRLGLFDTGEDAGQD